MNILIIYSEERKTHLEPLFLQLQEHGIRILALSCPDVWMIEHAQKLLPYLKKITHSLFAIDKQDCNHPFFIFSCGYCLGACEKSYLLDFDDEVFPVFWKDYFQFVRTDEAINKIKREKVRFQAFIEKRKAKKQLIKDGIDVSKGTFVEAVEEGELQIVELFIKAGFLPSQTDKHGVPLLCLAARKNHFAVLEILLRAGADVNAKSHDRDNTPLMDAAARGDHQMIQELLKHGAGVDGQSREGQTALVLAIGQGDEESARLLIEAGADAFITDNMGMNAFLYAQLFGKKSLLELIEQHKK